MSIIQNGQRPLHLLDNNIPQGPPSAPLPSPKRNPRRQSSISYYPSNRTDSAPRPSPTAPRHALGRSNSVGGHRRSLDPERAPLTFSEKHADLLHFIAQKESKCLELRSQLAVHEAELLQLKRKWERIVNRGLDRPITDTDNNSGAVLEGIREGVQGVSRLIAAGLAITDLPPAPTSVPPRVSHSSSHSTSSISTHTTKSTRFSQSSTSSLGEDPASVIPETHEDESAHKSAKKTTSLEKSPTHSGQENTAFSGSAAGFTTTKMHRRKSRDAHDFAAMPTDDLSLLRSASSQDESAKQKAIRIKRSSLGDPTAALAALSGRSTSGMGSAPPVSSWVGTVGKKWEELQRGSAFSNSQKRASTLLSDVSHSIASVLSAPPSSLVTPHSFSSPLSLSAVPPVISRSCSTPSLLDDDDDTALMSSSSIMTPDTKPTLSPPSPATPYTIPGPIVRSKSQQSDDEEWNW